MLYWLSSVVTGEPGSSFIFWAPGDSPPASGLGLICLGPKKSGAFFDDFVVAIADERGGVGCVFDEGLFFEFKAVGELFDSYSAFGQRLFNVLFCVIAEVAFDFVGGCAGCFIEVFS